MSQRKQAVSRYTAFLAIALVGSVFAFGGEIHKAALKGDLEKVKGLLKDNPALVSSQDNSGWTPLHWAAAQGQKDVVELLLANKAEVNAKASDGTTALYWAALRGHQDVVELLRQHGGHELSGTIDVVANVGDLAEVKALIWCSARTI